MDAAEKRPLMFSNRALVSLSVPIVIEALLSILTGMVDSVMVSSAGETAVSAVSLVDSINILFITVILAVINGGVVVTAQYIGSGNTKNARTSANQLLYASTAVSIIFMAVLLTFAPQILRFVFGSVEPAVFEQAKTYFYLTLISYPLYAVGASGTSLLRSMTRSRMALFITGSANLLNVIGNAILIYVFDMGVAGAAIATTFSRLYWAVMSMIIVHNKLLPVYFENLLKFRFNWDIMKRVLTLGLANGLENGLFHIGKISVSSLVSSFGTIAIAANSVANTLCNFGWTTVGSMGTVLLTVVGQCMGAREIEQAKMYTKKFMSIAFVLVVTLFGAIFLLRNQLVLMFSFGEEALAEAAYYTGMASLLTIGSMYALSFVPVSAFRAAGDTKYAVTLAVSSMFTFRVALSYLLGLVFDMGLTAVWIGMAADWACRSIINTIHFRRGKWLTKKVI